MQYFSQSNLMADIVAALQEDITQPRAAARFACCPIIAFTYEKNTAIGRLVGDIGLANIKEFSAALDELLPEKVQKVILDLEHVTLSRTAMGALVAFSATTYGLNKRLYLYKPSAQINDLLIELAIKGFYVCLDSEDDILATIVV